MNAGLIKAVSARAAAAETRTDESRTTQVAAPLSDSDLKLSVERLGFSPPDLLIQLYRDIGNGGFGPGYGMAGLAGGAVDDQKDTAVDLYCSFVTPDPSDAAWQWPRRILPFCHWGCAMQTCLDCTDDEMRLLHWDPNVMEHGMDPNVAIYEMSDRLPDWLAAWAAGEDIWARMRMA
ncbi:MAG: SMI1/KNR4 family protein [Silicimonas sp.]|nr:SMI1/KNR4 family protein [Silicimonas sp.]